MFAHYGKIALCRVLQMLDPLLEVMYVNGRKYAVGETYSFALF